MPRIEIELTSSRPDGTWTWRAAGARQPKGALDGSILYSDAKVGDVVRAESEMGLDGIKVTSVTPPKTKRQDPERLTLLGSGGDEPGVTGDGVAAARRGETLKSDRPRGRDRDRFGPGGGGRDGGRGAGPRSEERRPGGPRSDAGRPGGPRSDAGRPGGPRSDSGRPGGPRSDSGRPGGPRSDSGRAGAARSDRERPARAPEGGRPDGERRAGGPRNDRHGAPGRAGGAPRPRAKKLQAGRKHRDAALAGLPPEQRPVAEQVLRGGMAAVRQALADQNARAKASGEPEVRADALITMAEGLVPVLRAAEWRDRAEAVAADMDAIALRDLRAIVTGSDAAGRDDESRALVAQLREGLERRSTADQEAWLSEIRQCLVDGRLVRALRVSARPPEPAARLPEAMAKEMSEATGNALAPEVATERWMALLEAAMSSPVRAVVKPKGLPTRSTADLSKAVMLATPRMPGLRELLGSSAPSAPSGPARIPPPPSPPPPSASPPEAPLVAAAVQDVPSAPADIAAVDVPEVVNVSEVVEVPRVAEAGEMADTVEAVDEPKVEVPAVAENVEVPDEPDDTTAPEPVEVAEVDEPDDRTAPEPAKPEADPSGDDGNDAVLVEELG